MWRHAVCARACQAVAESARRKGWGRRQRFREPSLGVHQGAEQPAAGIVVVPSVNAATGISHQAGKAQLFTSLRNGERENKPTGSRNSPSLVTSWHPRNQEEQARSREVRTDLVADALWVGTTLIWATPGFWLALGITLLLSSRQFHAKLVPFSSILL